MINARHYMRASAVRAEKERGLRVTTVRRDEPDVESLARIIAQMTIDDPLGLAAKPDPDK